MTSDTGWECSSSSGHPRHLTYFADPCDRAGDHDLGHPLRLQLRLQAVGSGEGVEQRNFIFFNF